LAYLLLLFQVIVFESVYDTPPERSERGGRGFTEPPFVFLLFYVAVFLLLYIEMRLELESTFCYNLKKG